MQEILKNLEKQEEILANHANVVKKLQTANDNVISKLKEQLAKAEQQLSSKASENEDICKLFEALTNCKIQQSSPNTFDCVAFDKSGSVVLKFSLKKLSEGFLIVLLFAFVSLFYLFFQKRLNIEKTKEMKSLKTFLVSLMKLLSLKRVKARYFLENFLKSQQKLEKIKFCLHK